MRPDAEARRNRLEHLLLLMNAPLTAPPPRLVNEGAVRRVHQSDDSVVDAQWQVGGEAGDAVLAAEDGETGRRLFRLAAGARVRHVNPNVSVLLFAGKVPGVDFSDVELRIRSERGDRGALARLRLETPAVIVALELRAIEVSERKRHSPMRTTIPQREWPALIVASEDQRGAEQHGRAELLRSKLVARQRRVPETAQHLGLAS